MEGIRSVRVHCILLIYLHHVIFIKQKNNNFKMTRVIDVEIVNSIKSSEGPSVSQYSSPHL